MIVVTFDDMEEAGQVRDAIRSAQKEGYMSLDDSAVVVRDTDGKVHVKNELDRGIKVGAVAGGFLGLFIGFLFAPIGALIIGASLGGLIGKSVDLGISKDFIKEVTDSLEPGTSAIFLIVREGNPNMAVAAFKPYKGTVIQTTLDPEDEETLQRVLKERK
jgi:uncharacterized membrane protein